MQSLFSRLTARRCVLSQQTSVAWLYSRLVNSILTMLYPHHHVYHITSGPQRGLLSMAAVKYHTNLYNPCKHNRSGITRVRLAGPSCCEPWQQLSPQRTVHTPATGKSCCQKQEDKRSLRTHAAASVDTHEVSTNAEPMAAGVTMQQLPSLFMGGNLPLPIVLDSSVRRVHSSSSDRGKLQATSSSRKRNRRKPQESDLQEQLHIYQPAGAMQQGSPSHEDCPDPQQLVQQQQCSQQPHTQRPPLQQACRLLLIGIDPDTNGALAVISADLVPGQLQADRSNGSSDADADSKAATVISNGKQAAGQPQEQHQLLVDLSTASITVYDMPVESVPLRKKNKMSPQRYRRRLNIARAIATIKKILHQQQMSMQQTSSSADTTNSSRRDQPVLLRAFLEVSSIVPTNGSLSTLNQGFSIGAWTAALLALGFEVSTVHVRHWKKDLGLLGRDKECSRTLAQMIYNKAGNCQQHLLSRKKDHGRAEALLVAAWGCGWSATDTSSNNSNGKGKKKGSSNSSSSKAIGSAEPSSSSSSLQNSCSSAGAGAAGGDWVPWCGPLRDAIRMDSGMHVMSEEPSDDRVGKTGDQDVNADDDLADLLMFGAAAVEPAAAVGSKKKSKSKGKGKSKKTGVKVTGDSSSEAEGVKGRRKVKAAAGDEV